MTQDWRDLTDESFEYGIVAKKIDGRTYAHSYIHCLFSEDVTDFLLSNGYTKGCDCEKCNHNGWTYFSNDTESLTVVTDAALFDKLVLVEKLTDRFDLDKEKRKALFYAVTTGDDYYAWQEDVSL